MKSAVTAWLAGGACAALLAGCTTLKTPSTPAMRSHLLEPAALPAAVVPGLDAPALAVRPVRAGALLDGSRMQYRRDGVLASFADNRWSAPPQQLFGHWLVAALERSGAVAAVVAPGDRGVAGLRLESELAALYQDFNTLPSHARIEVRVQLVTQPENRVVATRRVTADAVCVTDDPDGGVAAARVALAAALAEITQWIRQATEDGGAPPR
jgi:ABC-type uncharacterized transport system auxiliary subunit